MTVEALENGLAVQQDAEFGLSRRHAVRMAKRERQVPGSGVIRETMLDVAALMISDRRDALHARSKRPIEQCDRCAGGGFHRYLDLPP